MHPGPEVALPQGLWRFYSASTLLSACSLLFCCHHALAAAALGDMNVSSLLTKDKHEARDTFQETGMQVGGKYPIFVI
jgi:hypothetical protein